jgi:hypothetical protein
VSDRYDKQGDELACAFGTARCPDRISLARQIAAALRAARLTDASDYEAIQLAEDPRWLVNDLLNLLADSRDYTQRSNTACRSTTRKRSGSTRGPKRLRSGSPRSTSRCDPCRTSPSPRRGTGHDHATATALVPFAGLGVLLVRRFRSRRSRETQAVAFLGLDRAHPQCLRPTREFQELADRRTGGAIVKRPAPWQARRIATAKALRELPVCATPNCGKRGMGFVLVQDAMGAGDAWLCPGCAQRAQRERT